MCENVCHSSGTVSLYELTWIEVGVIWSSSKVVSTVFAMLRSSVGTEATQ